MNKVPEVAVGVFCLDQKKRICLVRSKKRPDFLTLPGGRVKFNETVEQCASRELLEETSTLAQNLVFLSWGEAISPDKHQIFFNFRCETSSPGTKTNDPNEIEEVFWLDIEAAKTDRRVLPRTREEITIFLR